MKKIISKLLVLLAIVTSIMFSSSCSLQGDNNVSGKSYVITETKVESERFSGEELERLQKMADFDKGLILTFNEDGTFSGTVKSLGGTPLYKWEQEGKVVNINGGVTSMLVTKDGLEYTFGNLSGIKTTLYFTLQE